MPLKLKELLKELEPLKELANRLELEEQFKKEFPGIHYVLLDKDNLRFIIETDDKCTKKEKDKIKNSLNNVIPYYKIDKDMDPQHVLRCSIDSDRYIASIMTGWKLCLDEDDRRKLIEYRENPVNEEAIAKAAALENKVTILEQDNKQLQENVTQLKSENEELNKGLADKLRIDPIQDAIEKLKSPESICDNRKEIVNDDGTISYNVELAEYGKNNTQIFTRKQDIDIMIDSIGRENILKPETTILEPTSGDGAFTVRILQYRLKRIRSVAKTANDYILLSLQALSTIYAIEYEADTVFVQRCNLYTTMRLSYEEFWKSQYPDKEVEYDKSWDDLTRKILFDNIIWGAFAATNHPEYKNYDTTLGFDRASNRTLNVVKWNIKLYKGKLKYSKKIIS